VKTKLGADMIRRPYAVREIAKYSVQRDQQIPVDAAHGVQAVALVQFGHQIGEHGMEHGRLDWIEFRADLTVAWDLAYAEQRLTVRTALAGLEMALMSRKRRTLHEERANAASAKSAMS
jgi:hypothetical protein